MYHNCTEFICAPTLLCPENSFLVVIHHPWLLLSPGHLLHSDPRVFAERSSAYMYPENEASMYYIEKQEEEMASKHRFYTFPNLNPLSFFIWFHTFSTM